MSEERVRVRFAPSPTGPLHMGGVRTALFNYLWAKKYNGDFLLRIEDTDQTRYVPGAEDYIIESLQWIGIQPDEGVRQGGPFGPYRQSDRKEMYADYANQLIDKGLAYYAFDTPEELDAMRQQLKAANVATPQYNAITRQNMKNSLTLPGDEVNARLDNGDPYVVRFKMPRNKEVKLYDEIRGWVQVHTSKLDDKILFKSDGMPTYHLANVVDDHLMRISHVIRGEEWLPSTPLHVLMYDAFGWKRPKFAHLPLLLKPNGKGKLSKRDGDKLGFPVFPLEWRDPKTGEVSSGYREKGYFPEAFINILAFLGWNPGTDQELFTLEELVDAFDLKKVGKSGAKFDPEKARWYNHQYLRLKSNDELAALFQPFLQEKNIEASDAYVADVAGFLKERAQFVSEFWDQSYYFFVAPEAFDNKVVKKKWKADTPQIIAALKEQLRATDDFSVAHLENLVKTWIEDQNLKMGQVMNALRLCLTGGNVGPGLFDIMNRIGKKETLNRIAFALEKIPEKA